MSNTAITLNSKFIEVDVKDLGLGMYVSVLDRPWLETPFLFQGFTITSQDEINELRRHCQKVYVDAEQTDATVDLVALVNKRRSDPAVQPSPSGMELPSHRQVDRSKKSGPVPERETDPTPSVYTNIVDLRRELAQAKDQFAQASILIKEVMDNLNGGGKLDGKMAQKAVQPIIESVIRNDSAMSWLVRMRQTSDYIYTHSVSSAVWAIGMARHIGMPKDAIENVGLGAMLLDIGKTCLPKELLAKPEPLTDAEMGLVRRHVELGLRLLDETDGIDDQVKVMVRTHHERHDGSGYPLGLSGQQIPVFGRIAGIVDYYDAVTSTRPYAKALSSYDCLREMNKMAGVLFQKELVEQFIQSIGFFPPGTLVQLSDRSVAVVVARNRRHRLKPEVLVIMDPEHNTCPDFILVDLQMEVQSVFTGEVLFIDKGLEPGSFGIDPADYFL